MAGGAARVVAAIDASGITSALGDTIDARCRRRLCGGGPGRTGLGDHPAGDPIAAGAGAVEQLSQGSGDVSEVAIGTGRNLPFYGPDVHLTAVEFSPAMLEIARDRASALGRQVDLRRAAEIEIAR